MKRCTKCGEPKDEGEFNKNRSKKDGLSPHCKTCHRLAGRKWHIKNREKARERGKRWYRENKARHKAAGIKWKERNKEKYKRINRDYMLRSRYGITTKEYEDLLLNQGGVCACCQQEAPVDKNLYVDHDHGTGAIRGLLCLSCNVGIGYLGDDLEGVLRAVHYLASVGS